MSAQSRARRARVLRRLRLISTYESAYPLQRITYNGRYIKSKSKDVRLNIDVRNFIQPDVFALNFANVSGATRNANLDMKAWLIQKAVCQYMTYVYDEQNTGYTEFWQFPFETLALRCGDCEDGAILMASAMIAAGIPANRVRVFAGWVKTGDPQNPWGGHGYVVYLRNYDLQTVPLDWCYYPDPQVHIYNKPTLAANKNYGDAWFSFNNDKSWGEKAVRFSSRANLEDKFQCLIS